MKKIISLLLIAFALISVQSCDNGGDGKIPTLAEDALKSKYPLAEDVTWKVKDQYHVASFKAKAIKSTETMECSAWFDKDGKWYMTDSNINFAIIPDAVKKAFEVSDYSKWKIEEVDKIERDGVETMYVIEVEGMINGVKTDIDLYYSANGVLAKKIVDADADYDYEDYIPSASSTTIENFIKTTYPNSRIVDIDRENNITEVEIIDGSVYRELIFDRQDKWLYSKTEVRKNEIPLLVMQSLDQSDYRSHRIDDIDHYKTTSKEYYRFDLESSKGDVKIDISMEGLLSVVSSDSDHNSGNESGLNETVKNFITEKYPKSIIKDFDYDDGLLEVEVLHEGISKDIYFNGANKWVRTQWDVKESELSDAVKSAIKKSQYASYNIDDIEYIETLSSKYYLIEMEDNNDNEIILKIAPNGDII